MTVLWQFAPILLFVSIFVGSGVYFSLSGEKNAFTLLSPVTAIIPAIMLAWIRNKKTSDEKMVDFLKGIGHKDIINMCVIFLAAGAFGEVTKSIGSVESAINLAVSLIPSKFLLIGVFFLSAFISMSIGTAMGTIAAVGPIAAELSLQVAGLSAPLSMGAVVGGAMFGDNLSLVSNTTIAAISSQGADVRKKFAINLQIAVIASFIAILLMRNSTTVSAVVQSGEFSLLAISPYIILLIMAFSKINVLVCLAMCSIFAGAIGCFTHDGYGFLAFSADINSGFKNVNGIMLLALMIGGLSGLIGDGAIKEVTNVMLAWISKKKRQSVLPQFVIAGLVSLSTILLANNVIAIIFCGKVAKNIAKNNGISPHYSATILEVFACSVKGLLPYGTQVLLASSIANISPLSIVSCVYYCHTLIGVSILFILMRDKNMLQ